MIADVSQTYRWRVPVSRKDSTILREQAPYVCVRLCVRVCMPIFVCTYGKKICKRRYFGHGVHKLIELNIGAFMTLLEMLVS